MTMKEGRSPAAEAGKGCCGPGRPRQLSDADRRRHIVESAQKVFLGAGYHASTMDDIARQAGMSKKTIYQVFPSKESLFEALVRHHVSVLTQPIEETSGSTRDILTRLLTDTVNVILSPNAVGMMRMIISEAPQAPELPLAIYRQCLNPGNRTLEAWLARQKRDGVLAIDDPNEEASMLVDMAVGGLHRKVLMHVEQAPPEAEIKARVARAIEVFLRGVEIPANRDALKAAE